MKPIIRIKNLDRRINFFMKINVVKCKQKINILKAYKHVAYIICYNVLPPSPLETC